MADNKIIGIAGGIGSGKSVVSRILRCMGYPVYDCDYQAKLLMARDETLIDEIKRIIGKEAYSEKGNINKEYISKKIFTDIELREKLNNVIHKEVCEDFKRYAKVHKNNVFIESAILFTSGLHNMCNEIFLVEAPLELRLSRTIKRSNLSQEAFHKIVESQREEENLKRERNCKVITNDGEKSVISQLEHLTKDIEIC